MKHETNMKKQKTYLLEINYNRKYEPLALEIFEGDIKEHIKYMKDTHGATLRVFEIKEVKIK